MTFTFADWSGFAALMLAVASPVITSIANNCPATKLRKLDLREASERERRQSLRRYLSAASACLSFCDNQNLTEYNRAFGDALAYLPLELQHTSLDLHDKIRNRKLDEAHEVFEAFAAEVASII